MTPVAILVRVSTRKQETDRQVHELNQVAATNGWTVVEVIEETISGTATTRHGLDRVLDLARQSQIRKVLVHEVSRVSRKNSTSHVFLDTLCDLGVSLYWHAHRIETLLPDGRRNPAASIMFTLLAEKPLESASSLADDIIGCIEQLRAENGRQAATIAEARRQFDILSKLGNGDRVGNGVGNGIAVKALAAMDAGRHEAIFWNPRNGVVQDHRDGTVVQPDTDNERAKRGLPPFTPEQSQPETLKLAIARAINRFSAEKGSDTPDFILADYLLASLDAFDAAVRRRTEWCNPTSGPG